MSLIQEFNPTERDVEWAANFAALNNLLSRCTNSEKATLLLSTCRNAYLTANALFVDLQVLMGDAVSVSPLRAGCDLLARSEASTKITEYFARAIQTIREYETKRDVWKNRHSLMADVENTKNELKGLDSSRIDLILSKNRLSDEGRDDGWDYELVALDLQDRPSLDGQFTQLDRIFTILKSAAEMGWNASIAINVDADAQGQLDLGNAGGGGLDRTRAAKKVLELTLALAAACDWPVTTNEEIHTINLTTGYVRPQNISLERKVSFHSLRDSDSILAATRDLAVLIREASYFAHSEMCAHFKPNIAKTPLPEPFVIALPPPEPTFDDGHVPPPEVVRIRCPSGDAPGERVRVAVADLSVRVENVRPYRLLKQDVEQVKTDVRRALQVAEENGCAAVVFPEYSLPSSMDAELLELAKRHKLVVVAGLEGNWIEGKVSDRAIVAIPGAQRPYYQGKQEPSLDEEAGQAFNRDGKLHLFTSSPIGDFAVILCSDLMQLSILQSWKPNIPLPELLFVVARNKYPDLYVNLAKADSLRCYAAVIIANVYESEGHLTNEGSCAIVPLRGESILKASNIKVDGTFLKSLSIYDISLHALRGRSRGKPEKDYLAVPRSAQRD